MSELERLWNDSSTPPSLRRALEGARRQGPSPQVAAAILTTLAAGTGATGGVIAANAAGKGSPIAAKLFGTTMAMKAALATAIFVAGGVTGGVVVHTHDVRQAAALAMVPAPAAAPQIAKPLESEPAVEAPVPPVPAASVLAPVEPPTAQTSTVRPRPIPVHAEAKEMLAAPVASAVGPEKPRASSSHEQLASLREIQETIAGGRPVDALSKIEAHRARFPGSPFDQELLLLEAQARGANDATAACDVLQHLRRSYPTSLLQPRIQSLQAQFRCEPQAP